MAGRYRAYPEYNDSGVKMLGRIPKRWDTRAVRYLLQNGSAGIKIGPFGSALKLDDMVESGIRIFGQENVINGDFTLGKRKISLQKYKEMKVYTAVPGDLLVTMMGTSGRCAIVPENADLGIIDSHLLRLRVKSIIIPRFFRLLLDECHEIKSQVEVAGKGSIMHGLNSGIVKNLSIPLPPAIEQKKILGFLDHETTKIDNLIEKQQKLIALLKEKRQAVISHAVTKGLNPDAPIKDSGVEWLGEVPEHWEVGKVKFVINNMDKMRVPLSAEERSRRQGTYPYYGASGIIDYIDDYLFDEETILLGEDGANLLARSTPLAFLANGKYWVNNHAHILKPKDGLCRFWVRSLENLDVSVVVSGSAQPKLTAEALGDLQLVYPSKVEERVAVAKYIDEETANIDTLIEKAQHSIDLSKERRTALISAAVTGKIDVRNWQPPPTHKETR